MKKLLLFVLITFSTITAFSQKENPSLNSAISQYSKKILQQLFKSERMGRYKIENKNTFFSDIDGDGDFDAVTEIFFCESSSCHPTTQVSKLVVFTNQNNKFTLLTDKTFRVYGKINSINKGKIRIDVYGFGEDDPQCCPSLQRQESFILKGKTLVKTR
ncbi:MAG TPA: hypothetical protein PKY82_00420 [Pyrinomonadaceae bacterium]|nr:hypothetical protein [Pyrinomonadaceae bacterium]